MQFFPLTPCRVVDTRDADGTYGGPALAAGADRSFVLASQCGVPSTARAVAINLTVTLSSGPGTLVVYPGGLALPPTSSLNYRMAQTRANNVIVGMGPAGDVVVHCGQATGSAHVIIDVGGYFE